MTLIKRKNRINQKRNQCHLHQELVEKKRIKALMLFQNYQLVLNYNNIFHSYPNHEMPLTSVEIIAYKRLLTYGGRVNWIPSKKVRRQAKWWRKWVIQKDWTIERSTNECRYSLVIHWWKSCHYFIKHRSIILCPYYVICG